MYDPLNAVNSLLSIVKKQMELINKSNSWTVVCYEEHLGGTHFLH